MRSASISTLAITLTLAVAFITGPGCGPDDPTDMSKDASTPAGAGGSGGTGGTGSSMASGDGGAGGGGGSTGAGGSAQSTLMVGVGKQLINPTLVETEWNDKNGDGYWDPPAESFTDTNNNGTFDATWIAGFGNSRPAKGINDALEVRALALRDKGDTVVICILDTIGYFIDEMDQIRADPKVKALGIDHLLIGSTHVHQGVDTVGLWGPTQLESGVNPEYMAYTRAQAALAIEDAVNSLKPARMRVAQRRTVDQATNSTLAYVNDTRDPIIYDPTLTIAQFTEEANPKATIATLLQWSAHPEYAGSHNNMLSADYVHWLREVVEAGIPSEGVAGLGGTSVFVQGALGGQIGPGGGVAPIDSKGMPVPQAGLPKAEAAGTSVAKIALAALAEDGKEASATNIIFREKELFARVDNTAYQFLADSGVLARPFYNYDMSKPIGPDNVPSVRTQIAYFQLGPLAMITAPGELNPELWVGGYDGSWSFGQQVLNEVENAPDLQKAPKAPYLRDLMLGNPGVEYAFVAGLTQDFLGYIIANFNFVVDDNNPYFVEAAGDHYEETNSIGPLCEEQIQHPMMDLAKGP